jgi:DNA polymerase
MRDISPPFRLENLGFIDFETVNRTDDIKQVGASRYMENASAIICAYAIGGGAVHTFCARKAGDIIEWGDVPGDFSRFYYRCTAGEAKWVAWNAGFDRLAWNYATLSFPELHPHHIIDAMAQATAAGLPPDLAEAAKQSRSTHKVADGKDLIKLFCIPGGLRGVQGTPLSHPAEWNTFRNEYAVGDIIAMRDVFLCTRQLALEEWKEYWAMEAINDRGVLVDLKMAAAAAALAREDKGYAAHDLTRLTDGAVTGVGQVARMIDYLRGVLPEKGQEILTRREEEEDEDGKVTKPGLYTLKRSRIEKLIPYCEEIGEATAKRVLEIRLYGGSTTPAKFQKILDQNLDGTLYGQYVFNGAPMTGRASSRGVQIHNLSRSTLDYEHDAIEALLSGCTYQELADLGDDTPVSRKLSLLIRPTFVPHETNLFVWSDWSNIEARVLPWLAGAEARLDIFRAVDADPRIPDLYTRTAADICHLPIKEITKPLRQRGKVAELALGFGGGLGALQTMGANYGMYLDDDEGREIVRAWRAANQWCVDFWGRHDDGIDLETGEPTLESTGLWGAANRALLAPGSEQWVGDKLCYVYMPEYLGGSLVCALPSGRLLTYRDIRYERVADLDEEGEPTGTSSVLLRFSKGHGRAKIWHGTLCENVVQAVAADILRGTLVRLEAEDFRVRLHTHDEVLLECHESLAGDMAAELRAVMQQGFDWSKGLPIMSEEQIAPYYTKVES